MSDRTTPPGSGSGRPPEEGTPEYDWLYGRGAADRRPTSEEPTEVIAAQPRDRSEATRVLPAVPRESPGATAPVRQPYQTPPPAPPPSTRPPGGPSRGPGHGTGFRRPRPRLRWLLYLLVLWLVFLVVTPFWAWKQVSKVDDSPTGKRPADQPGTTYLLVGSDARSSKLKGSRTDSIMILHTGSGPNLLMSIPRDSLVPIPGHGTTKINAAFAYGGPRLLVRTIEKDTGIRIDHYAEIGFGGFKDVVDAVGGITICPTQNMKDPLAHLNVKKGCQEVDGTTALAYSRSRHVSGLGDIDRAKHQREVVAAIGKKALSPWSFLNPFRYWRLNFSAADSIRVGTDTGPVATARMFLAMTRVNGTSGLTCGVPISNLNVDWDPQRSKQMFAKIIADKTDEIGSLCTPSGLPKSVTG